MGENSQNVTTTLTFNDPISFDQIVVLPPESNDYIPAGSFTVWWEPSNIQCISYEDSSKALNG